MGTGPVMLSGLIQGIGLGLVFVPLSTLAFATIAPKYRVDATAIFSLVRNVGSGVGISVVTSMLSRMSTINQMEIGSRLSFDWGPLRDALQAAGGIGRMASALNGLVMQQATMIAFLDDFKLMMWVTLASLPIVLLLRRPKRQPVKDPAPPAPAMAE